MKLRPNKYYQGGLLDQTTSNVCTPLLVSCHTAHSSPPPSWSGVQTAPPSGQDCVRT
ncbi:hypothetical protein EJ08DRAFT_647639 [Tothia fuscella]|uniref:Uncharacterized protein n=1 Tax=Tothia fuscella TaxID=1048955 RepID=A0A9P4TZU1_9PEZI|nr:hypothetical protein EJ08DRAFT_647639 [Tothia fuscella]